MTLFPFPSNVETGPTGPVIVQMAPADPMRQATQGPSARELKKNE